MASTDVVPQETGSSAPVNDIATIKADYKRESFNKDFLALVKQSEETIKTRYSAQIALGESPVELVCLNKYLSMYNNMKPEEHFRYFETLYNRKRKDILDSIKDDRWLRNGRVIIQFGEGINLKPAVQAKLKQTRIMLSDIFLIACDLQTQAEKALDGIEGVDDTTIQAAGGKDLVRPTILLLHLMRIFYYLAPDSDKDQVGAVVTRLESDLGMTRRTVGQEPWKTQQNAVPMSQAATGGLSGLFTMAQGLMEKMGYQPPPGMKPPSEGEISKVIESVFSNQTTQNAIQGMFTSLQGCQDFGSAMQQVVGNVTDPTTMAAIQESVAQTAQAAAMIPK